MAHKSKTPTRVKSICVRMHEETYDLLKEECRKNYQTMADVVYTLIIKHLNKVKK